MAGKADIKAGSAYVELLLKDSKFVKGLRSAGQRLTNFGSGVSKWGGVLAAAGAAITAPMVAAAKAYADAGSEILHMSQRTGIAVEALSELKYAAEASGASLEDVEGAVRKMQKFLSSAAGGAKEARSGLRDLGLTIDELTGKSPDQQFEMIAAKIAAISDPTKRAAKTMEIFGKKGTAILPMIEDLAGLKKEARDMGLVMSTQAAEGAEKLHKAFYLLARVSKGIYGAIGSAVAPALTKSTELMIMATKIVRDFVRAHKPAIAVIFQIGKVIAGLGAALAIFGGGIMLAGKLLGLMATGIGAVGTVLGVLLNPITLVTAALAAGAYVWAQYTESGQNAIAALMEFLGPLLETAKQTFQGISDAIAGGDLMLAGQVAIAGLRLALLQGLAALAEAVGGAAGDVLGSIGSKLMSGDFAGAWQDTITAMAEQWYAFSEGIVAAFTFAASAIKDVWLKATSAIANAILDIASQEGILGDLANKVLGYDDRKNAAKTKRMQAAALARGNDTVNMEGGGNAQSDAANILGGQAAAFQSKLDALNAGRQKLTNDAGKRTANQTAGGAGQANAAVDAAQAELDALTARAKEAADKAEVEAAQRKDRAAGAADGASGLKQGVVSTFSAAALLAGGGGGVIGELKGINGKMDKFIVQGAKSIDEQRAANRMG